MANAALLACFLLSYNPLNGSDNKYGRWWSSVTEYLVEPKNQAKVRFMNQTFLWQRGLLNSMKLWAMPCRAIHDAQVMVEGSDNTRSTWEGNGKSLQFSCPENPMNSVKMQKDMTLEDESPRSEGVQYATGKEHRTTTNRSRKNGVAGPKQKWHSVVAMCGGESKFWCCKEQCCIGTWNVRTISQGIGRGQVGDDTSQHGHLTHQWTEMGGNGLI